MKRKITTLLCFVSLSLNLSLGLSSSEAFASEPKSESKPDPTVIINNYLEEYRTNCGIRVTEFESMQGALLEAVPHLINPVAENRALLSIECYRYWQNPFRY